MKFLKEVKLYDEFENFIKEEYGQELKDIAGEEKELMNVKELEEKRKLDRIREELEDLQLKDGEKDGEDMK